MSYLIVLLIGCTLGATLAHKSALAEIRADMLADFKALHARFDQLKEKL